MKLIIGLGNPGAEYQNTRHNSGFRVVEHLAKKNDLAFSIKEKFLAETAEGKIAENKVLLVRPQTFMNNSGKAIKKILEKNKVKPADVLVIFDDADMEFGKVRFRAGGSSGGHRGLQSVLNAFPKKADIARVKVGIGRPKNKRMELADFVLQAWSKEEEKEWPKIRKAAEEMVAGFLDK